MPEPDALDAALALFKDPASARGIPGRPLPPDVACLLAIAVGDEATLAAASRRSGFARQPLQEAAGFFIEQALLCRDADSYRVLGGGPHSTHEELRHNMALLMRWLHPDLQSLRSGPLDREVFAARVSRAWEDLKTQERRDAYDLRRPPAPTTARSESSRPSGSTGPRPNGGAPGAGKVGSGRTGASRAGGGKATLGKAGSAKATQAKAGQAKTPLVRAPQVKASGRPINGTGAASGPRAAVSGSALARRPLPLSVHKVEEPSVWIRLWGFLWGRR
ncbi:J domain-containing protein [Ancylobacter vacuolatus]|uniref:J domain-containing protein n=1 Tax=Ancylobacter vacuolatus TaxID=223389 RepID=A0ABU0DKN9_9HYPH|nr:hypothetical protein [Ancylobacter vacuolatus]MDQ0348990.1 hypothetical protein [Ancylobacter vacuolatus]